VRRALGLLGGFVLVLALAELALARRDVRQRAEEAGVGPLFARAEAENLTKQPALRVELPGATYTYGRVEGQWRCFTLHDAPADGAALERWLAELAGAEGFVRARTVAEAPTYGINAPETIRVSIQGPRAAQVSGGDVLVTLELGHALAGGAGRFVRKKGTKEIWSVAGDLGAPLAARVAPGLPPLLAPTVVPARWLGTAGGAWRIELVRGATRLELARVERTHAPLDLQPGALPWHWVLEPAGEARALDEYAAEAFVRWLENLPYVGVLPPAERAARLAAPLARVGLHGREGAPLELTFGAAGANGRLALWVEASATLYEVEPAVLALAVPERRTLLEASAASEPWSGALERSKEAR
jgi:hypothetical protein